MVRHSKRRYANRKMHRGGSGLSPLNPTPIDMNTNRGIADLHRIALTEPSPTLARSIPISPPMPTSPSPPPPLGITSGPAYGLKIGPPPLLSYGGSKKHNCGCKGGKNKKKSKRRKHLKGGGNLNLPNPFGKLKFDANPFNNQSNSSTGKVSSEQALADSQKGAFTSGEHTSQLHATTVTKTGGRRKSKRGRKMKGGGDFFKNIFNFNHSDSNKSESSSPKSIHKSESPKEETHKSDKTENKVSDFNPFDNESDSTTGKVSSEQAAADKREGAETSSKYTKQEDYKTILENALEHGKISGGRRKKSKKFKKHFMWNTKGKKYIAKTYKQHLKGVRLGHTHKKPKKR